MEALTADQPSPSHTDDTELIKRYRAALDRSAVLSVNTRRAYASRVAGYLAWLAATDIDGDPLGDTHGRDCAVRDYRHHLKVVRKRSPSTVNAHLTAVDHFYDHLGLGPAVAKREVLPDAAPRALDERDQRRFLRAVEHRRSARDRAIALTLFYTGVRVAELSALDVDDIELTARKGRLVVRAGKGDRYREVPLHPAARVALRGWLDERRGHPGATGPALFLNRFASRLQAGSVGELIVRLGRDVGLDDPPVTPHVLRHTLATQMLRNGADITTVARFLGHGDINTTGRYTLPTAADKARALDLLLTDD